MAGFILSVVVLMGGGAGWVVRDRAARSATMEREVNRALGEATEFQAQLKWPEALEAVKRAEGFLAGDASEPLRQHVRELRNDVKMVLRLEEIWMPREKRTGTLNFFSPLHAAAYADAFREFGIDVEALEPEVAAARIRARKIRLELALALDLWARAHLADRQTGDANWKRLLAVARAVDPDEWRNRMRAALERRDFKTLNTLADSGQSSDLPLQTLSLLVSSDHLEWERALSLLRQAQVAHPDNFHINFQLAWTYHTSPARSRPQDEAIRLSEAVRFYTAALAIRPRDGATAHFLGEVLSERGQREEAITLYRKAIALDPDLVRADLALIRLLLAQGKRDEAIAETRAAVAARPNHAPHHNNLAWIFVSHPDARFRDARLAIELGSTAVELAPEEAAYWNTLGAARYRGGDWNGAIGALEKSMALCQGGDSFDWFFLAMARWQLGDKPQARSWYDKAVGWMEKNQPKAEELIRFRAEAAALLEVTEQKH
jgi:serine/threonine-protein kinase